MDTQIAIKARAWIDAGEDMEFGPDHVTNLLKERDEMVKEIAELYCPASYEFRGLEYPACGECIVCKCEKEMENIS